MNNGIERKQLRVKSTVVCIGSTLLALSLSCVAMAQSTELTDAQKARAAELECLVAGVCGDVATAEELRAKEVQDGMTSRAMMSIGSIKSAIPSSSAGATNSESQPAVREYVPNVQNVQSVPSTTSTYSANAAASVAAAPRTMVAPSPLRAKLMVNFDMGSDKLTDDSIYEILSFAAAIKNLEDKGYEKKFIIEGHADAVGTDAINLPLSERRAKAVVNMLVNSGVKAEIIDYAGYGSQRPLAGTAPLDPLNRRVEAVLVE